MKFPKSYCIRNIESFLGSVRNVWIFLRNLKEKQKQLCKANGLHMHKSAYLFVGVMGQAQIGPEWIRAILAGPRAQRVKAY